MHRMLRPAPGPVSHQPLRIRRPEHVVRPGPLLVTTAGKSQFGSRSPVPQVKGVFLDEDFPHTVGGPPISWRFEPGTLPVGRLPVRTGIEVLRFFGLKTHQKATPFFLGLILGEFTVGSLWTIVGIIFGISTYGFYT